MKNSVTISRQLFDFLIRNDIRYRFLRYHARWYESERPVITSSENSRGHAPVILAEDELDELIDKCVAEMGEENI